MPAPTLAAADVDVLRKGVSGDVIRPGDAAYDEARLLWNGAFDRRPAVVVRCLSAQDVSAAVTFARMHGLELAVRGGGHSTGGLSGVDDGLVIDLSAMNQVETDVEGRRCRVGGGATLGQRDGATQEHGLATTAGIVGHTGVGGLTLTGGMGWLTRKHGLALDNVLAVQIVTADGKIRRASADEEPDLYWAVRGGGGNFGVVTEFEFQLHPVGPMVDFGLLFWPITQALDVLRLARRLFASMSTETNIIVAGINAPPEPFVPAEHHGAPGIALVIAGFGGDGEHGQVLEQINAELPPLFQLTMPMPYAGLQQMFDEANRFGLLAYDKATYVEDLSDDVAAVIADQLARKQSPQSAFFIYRLDGAYSEIGDDDTAFGGGRSPRYAVFLLAIAEEPAMLATDTRWAREFWDALQPVSMGRGSYLNGEAEYPDDRVRASFGPEKYARLAALKARYDPDNVFHRNANIPPAPQPPQQRTPGD
jgi:FAD/FMN-containing dehydrogenase